MRTASTLGFCRALLALVLLPALAGCDALADVDPEAGVEVASAEDLAAYRAAFVASGADDYRLRYDVRCFCTPTTVEVEVEEGRIVRTEIDGSPSTPQTVLDLYDRALAAFPEADGVTVRVRPGPVPIPVSVAINPFELVADEEVTYVVRGFERR